MNVSDTEVVWSILEDQGYARTLNPREADVWLLVTCSIRDGAEQVRFLLIAGFFWTFFWLWKLVDWSGISGLWRFYLEFFMNS